MSLVGGLVADDELFAPGELLVLFTPHETSVVTRTEAGFDSPYASLDALLHDQGIRSVRPLFTSRSKLRNVFKFAFPVNADLGEISRSLRQMPFVAAVTRNSIATINATPDDYYFNHDYNGIGGLDQWPLTAMQFHRAWDITLGDSAVVVAVIDNGFDWQHPDLDEKFWINSAEDINSNGIFDNIPSSSGGDIDTTDNDSNGKVDDVIGWDFTDDDNDPYPSYADNGSHGTAMSGIISAKTDNGLGVAGATWFSRVMALRAGNGIFMFGDRTIEAINYAVDNGALIVNMSFSTTNFADEAIRHAAIQAGEAVGVLFVASAGDNNNETARYPASHAEVVSVGAVLATKYKPTGTPSSSYGATVDIVASCGPNAENGVMACSYLLGATNTFPGDDSPHIFLKDQLATSGAAAEVSGALALLRAVYPDSPVTFIKAELFRGAEDLPDPLFGQGKLGAGLNNPYRSLTQWGAITSNTTWGVAGEATTIYVSGDVTVVDGVTLTIKRGTTIRIATDDNENAGLDTDRVEFNVDGSILVAGTTGDPVVIEGWNATEPGDWVGFKISDDSEGVTFRNCTIRDAEIAIDSYAPVTLRNVTIEDVDEAAMSIWSSTLTIDVSTIGITEADGIRLDESDATIDSTTIENYKDYGVYSVGNGIYDGALNITRCQFLGDPGGVYDGTAIYVETTDANGVISDSRFEDSEIGVKYYDSTEPNIDECVFTDNGTAIECGYGSSPRIEHCIDSSSYDGNITANDYGLVCTDDAAPQVGHCNFGANAVGVIAFDSASPVLQGYGANSFVLNTSLHIGNFAYSVTTAAQGNYWQLNTGSPNYYPKPTRISGAVDYTYALSAGPSPVSSQPEPMPDEKVVTGMEKAHPNPFNPTVHIPYSVARSMDVRIDIFDVSGRMVRALVHERAEKGKHIATWDGRNDAGAPVATSVYFARMRAGDQVQTQKLVLLK